MDMKEKLCKPRYIPPCSETLHMPDLMAGPGAATAEANQTLTAKPHVPGDVDIWAEDSVGGGITPATPHTPELGGEVGGGAFHNWQPSIWDD